MAKKGYVYIATNQNNAVLYTGVTSELKYRMESHKKKKYKNSFSARYNVNKLVYFEETDNMVAAHKREKQIKAGSRKKKTDLINRFNPAWEDLYSTLE